MRQILQNLSNGETQLVDVPCPDIKDGQVLIQTSKTLISVGTERMLIDFGKANWLDKARQQPDKVKMVLDKIRTDGLLPTIDAVRSKLDQPVTLGYCNVGHVIDGIGVPFKVGDRVVSNGNHAEIVRVPKNLVAKIPDDVDDESAAFVVLGAIALQGIRLANPTLGESVVVIGLGLIGLIAVQILKANGCRVLGIDYDAKKCELGRQFGAETVNLSLAEDPLSVAHSFSRGRGVDAVIITAATQSSEPIKQAATMSRKRGRIVLVGVVGLEFSRADFYEKEITFQVSCSYGPGRYDSSYEEKGNDYPLGFVRWTEQRNFEAILDMMSVGSINVKPLITHKYEFSDALEGYKQLNNREALGIVLHYPNAGLKSKKKTTELFLQNVHYEKQDIVCGFLGGGAYASRILIPAFKKAAAKLDTLVTSGGVSAVHQGRKNGFLKATTDEASVLENDDINTVVIVTRHNLHAKQIISALNKGKNVFVEKPLAITLEELDAIEMAFCQSKISSPCLMVGFNRRFSPLVVRLKQLMDLVKAPKSLIITINAGEIPQDHWTQVLKIGGGRIVGEGCHFIDLMRFLVGKKIVDFQAMQIGDAPGIDVRDDKAVINLAFEDGSFGSIHYLSNGGKLFPKERVEVFSDGGVIQLDNFRKMKGFGWKGFSKMNLLNQDKGQKQCVKAFTDAVRNGLPAPIPIEELLEVARVTINIASDLQH